MDAENIHEPMDFARRFGGVSRLYGDDGLTKLKAAHIAVIGIGGVGSWAVEALVRNAVGAISLIDLDNVSESNFNRQLHAMDDNIGKAKVDAMQARILSINPSCKTNLLEDFITPENVAAFLSSDVDGVIDCTDDATAKAALAAYCQQKKIALMIAGAAGGRLDPTRLQIVDLSQVKNDKLLAKVRTLLRSDYGYPKGSSQKKKTPKMSVNCIYSDETAIKPDAVCETDAGITGLNCAGYGSSVCVTAPMGFAASAWMLQQVLNATRP